MNRILPNYNILPCNPRRGARLTLMPAFILLAWLSAGRMTMAASDAISGTRDDPVVIVESVSFTGLVTVPVVEVERIVFVKQGLRPTRRSELNMLLDQDTKSLEYTGWFGLIAKPDIRPMDGKGNRVGIVWHLKENPILSGIEFRGNKQFSSKELMAKIALRPLAFSVSDSQRAKILSMIPAYVTAAWPTGKGLTDTSFKYFMLDRVLKPAETVEDTPSDILTELPGTPDIRQSAKIDPAGRYIYRIALMNRTAIMDYYHQEGYPDVQIRMRAYPVVTAPNGAPLIVNLVYFINEGFQLKVRKVRIHGLKNFDEKSIIDNVLQLTKPGLIDIWNKTVDIEKIKADGGQALIEFLRREGYEDARLVKTWIEIDPFDTHGVFGDFRECTLHFYLDQGELSYCETLTIIPKDSLIPTDTIMQRMLIKPGGVYSDQLLKEDIQMIQKMYGERGRLNARMRAEKKWVSITQHRRYHVTLTIDEGREISAGPIIIRGNDRTKDSVVMRYVKVYPGQRLDQKKLDDTLQALRNSRLFDANNIVVDHEPTANPEFHRVLVKVAEGRTGMLQLAASYDTSVGVTGKFQFEYRNLDITNLPHSWLDFTTRNVLRGGGQTVRLDLSAGSTDQQYKLEFIEPWLFSIPMRFTTSIYKSIAASTEFNRKRSGGQFGIGYRLGDTRWTAYGTEKVEQNEITDLKSDAKIVFRNDEGKRLLSQTNMTFRHSTADFPQFTTSGHIVHATVGIAGGALGGDDDFLNLEIGLNQFLPIYRNAEGFRHVLRLSAKFQAVEPYGRNHSVPAIQRLYAGGVNSVRGFRYLTISPRDDDVAVGGERMWIATIEYSIPILPQPAPPGTRRFVPDDYYYNYRRELIRLVFYADAGDVWRPSGAPVYFFHPEDRGGINTDGIRFSYGWGIIFKVPELQVPLKFFFSKVRKKVDGDRTDEFQFSIDFFSTQF